MASIDREAETRYFIAKCANIHSFKKCVNTCEWACRDRDKPPHPKDILTEAFSSGKVILIFSVNNCHGWHGYVEMIGPPAEKQPIKNCVMSKSTNDHIHKDDIESFTTESNFLTSDTVSLSEEELIQTKALIQDSNNRTCEKFSVQKKHWYYFPVRWEVNFINEFGEQCLPSKETENLVAVDGTPINKARNWQEVSPDIGQKICLLIDHHYKFLNDKRDLKLKQSLEKNPDPFYIVQSGEVEEQMWKKVVDKVERELGRVHLACPFGSQRYNLHKAESDTDMFIVYQANTKDLLGFDPPKHTVKNSDHEECDYTIHEVHRYCELILNGDPRCVETLFLHPDSLVQTSPEWKNLVVKRMLFLNIECLDKYLRDAEGSRGIKQLRRWCDDNPSAKLLSIKMCKLLYIVVRLLQNAKNIVDGHPLEIYRLEGSQERKLLMSIRAGDFPVEQAWSIIESLQTEISKKRESLSIQSVTDEAKAQMEEWLIQMRYTNFLEKH
ncbi:hypothetical protein CHS0354_034203 [Potamilus streckersoni]|uniref:YTH domain-containing protein n=1 Tax=Potamilus streckersoni TaxID=2493646 RepID=A0AAE0T2M3_9BIVA|nr:hypothetical protein CHS0354_034203 [Potamilus streckersoni]